MLSAIDRYTKEFTDRQFTRHSLFEELRDTFGVDKALYLGSYIHFTPSLVYPCVTYVDSFKTSSLIEDEEILDYIEKNKSYKQPAKLEFFKQDYTKKLPIKGDYNLLISQYAGFVSQAGKKYLRPGGILVANNSHGDASMANIDSDFELVAVANHTQDKWRISKNNLATYFLRKDGSKDNITELIKNMKGFGYTKTAANYIFKKAD